MGLNRTRSVLLGSGGFSTPRRRGVFRDTVSDLFSEKSEIIFIPYASHDWDSYTERMREFLGDQRLLNIDSFEDHEDAVKGCEAIYVGGGNSFLLIKNLHERGLIKAIRDKVASGTPYLGVSAGSNVACPTMMTTNDMPIVLPLHSSPLASFHFRSTPTTTRARSCSWMGMRLRITTASRGLRG